MNSERRFHSTVPCVCVVEIVSLMVVVVKAFPCTTCDETFCNRKDRNLHDQKHVGTYLCKWNQSPWRKEMNARRKQLQRQQTHNTEKSPSPLDVQQHQQFECCSCELLFQSKQSRNWHELDQHCGKYRCKNCNTIYKQKRNLLKHQRKVLSHHKEIVSYSCQE